MSAYIEPEHQKIKAAWERADMIANANPDEWRKDVFGRVIRFLDYNDFRSDFGWNEQFVHPREKVIDRNTFYLEAVHISGIPSSKKKAG